MQTSPRLQNNKGFIGKFIDLLKQEFEKDNEMKENLKKFRQKAEELEQSDALKKAREKFVSFNCN
jgi:import inner membrane translocase subunit TIM44